MHVFFFFQAEDGIRDYKVTGVQTCALPIFTALADRALCRARRRSGTRRLAHRRDRYGGRAGGIGRAACRGRGEISGGAGSFKKKKKKIIDGNKDRDKV